MQLLSYFPKYKILGFSILLSVVSSIATPVFAADEEQYHNGFETGVEHWFGGGAYGLLLK